MSAVTICTAGHVDHGKTTLVADLTGVDTDRLDAEKARGLSIELGFAPLELPSGRVISLIDVPGHERFIRTMVAGAGGVDLFLMVVAADDGVAAQTREHAQVLDALGVERGLAVVTKTDRADPGPALAELTRLLPGVPALACPAERAARAPVLLDALASVVAALPPRPREDGPPILHIDRVFSVAGAGTVATGTLRGGRIAPGDRVSLYPSGRAVRVRGVQVHGAAAPAATAGQRAAVALTGVARSEVQRGDALAAPGVIAPRHVIPVRLGFDPAGAARDLHAHHGTRTAVARLSADGTRLRCRSPLLVAVGDAIVLRDPIARVTLGGARVTAVAPAQPIPALSAPATAESMVDGPGAAPAAGPGPAGPAERRLAARLRSEGAAFPADTGLSDEERTLLPALCRRGDALRLAHGHHCAPDAAAAVESEVRAMAAAGELTLPALRDRLAVSRARAKAFLDHFDDARLTLRRPDGSRVLRRAVSAPADASPDART